MGEKTGVEKLFVLIPASKTDHSGLCTQMGQIHGHVGGPARFFILRDATHDRYRRFRRDAAHFAPDVFVEHHIAHYKQSLVGPFVLDLPDDPVQLSDHRVPFTLDSQSSSIRPTYAWLLS